MKKTPLFICLRSASHSSPVADGGEPRICASRKPHVSQNMWAQGDREFGTNLDSSIGQQPYSLSWKRTSEVNPSSSKRQQPFSLLREHSVGVCSSLASRWKDFCERSIPFLSVSEQPPSLVQSRLVGSLASALRENLTMPATQLLRLLCGVRGCPPTGAT